MTIAFTQNISEILTRNPEVKDKALAGVVEANIPGFQGSIKCVTKTYQFATGDKHARVFTIAPYNQLEDFFISIKRFLGGVNFNLLETANHDDITALVLGRLNRGSQEYNQALVSTRQALSQGRHIVIAIATDLSSATIYIENNSEGVCVLI